MSHRSILRHRPVSRLATTLAIAAALAACGGGRDVTPPQDDPSPGFDTASLALTYEQRDDGTYALFHVNVHSGVKVTLDEGADWPYRGRIIGDRAFFVRGTSVVAGNFLVVDSDLFSVRLDGHERKQLTSGPDRDSRMMRIGDRLVFSRTRQVSLSKLDTDVMSMRLDGSDLRALAANPDLDELVVGEPEGDVAVIQGTASNGMRTLSAVQVDGAVPARTIAGLDANPTFRVLAGDRVVFTTPGKVFSRRIDGIGAATDLFGQDGERFFADALGDKLFAVERVNGGPEVHLHMVNADGTGKASPLMESTRLVGLDQREPARLFVSRKVGSQHEFLVAPLESSSVGMPKRLSISDRFTVLAAMEGESIILRRDRYDDPDMGISTQVVSLRATASGVREMVLAERANLVDGIERIEITGGRLVLNEFTGEFVEGWPVVTYFSISPGGNDHRPLVQDGARFIHESRQVRKDGRAIFRRIEYNGPGAESTGSEVLSVNLVDGSVVRLSRLAKHADLVPAL